MRNKKVGFMMEAAVIAAIYVVLVVVFSSWSFGPIQFRIAEALTVLPFFTPSAIPGLFVGCFLANFMGGAHIMDVIFGSVATLIGAVGTYWIGNVLCKKMKGAQWFLSVPPILANTLIVPFVLRYAYGLEDAIWYMMITVGIGEIIVCGIIGMIFWGVLNRYKGKIFVNYAE